uniref:Ubiquitin-like domain-containing protein n=1 Tax=Oryza meridionalis TaxID=40149 RepID=A0A0E0CXK1_9ORYZ
MAAVAAETTRDQGSKAATTTTTREQGRGGGGGEGEEAASTTVNDLRTALRSSFAPALVSPDFHLFLKGTKLIADAKVGNLPVGPGESISFIPINAKSTPPHPPTWKPSSSSSAPNPWRKHKFCWHDGGDEDIYTKKPTNLAPPPPLSCHGCAV